MKASDSYLEKLALEGYGKYQTEVPMTNGEPTKPFTDLSEKEKLGWKKAVQEILESLDRDGLVIS